MAARKGRRSIAHDEVPLPWQKIVAVGSLIVGLGAATEFWFMPLIEQMFGRVEFWRAVLGFALLFCLLLAVYYDWLIEHRRFKAKAGETDRFARLLTSLDGNRTYAGIYSACIRMLLRGLDRVFGDYGQSYAPGRVHRWLGLTGTGESAAPLWTARAFDWAFLYAITYPVVAMLLVWAWSGALDPLGQALGFKTDAPPLLRWLSVAVLVGMVVCQIGVALARQLWQQGLFFAGWMLTMRFADVKGAGSVVIFYVAFFGIAPIVLNISGISLRSNKLRWAMMMFCLSLAVLTYLAPTLSPALAVQQDAYPVLLVLAAFTLINALFDWLALGLTRALLHKGLELGGRIPQAPLWFGLLDIVVSLILMALLAFALTGGALLLEHSACSAGGRPSPTVAGELAALADPVRRHGPNMFWLYIMLWTTQIFSVFNVASGVFSLLRGVPALNRRIHAGLSVAGGPGQVAQFGYALALAGQVTVALIVAVALYWGIGHFLFGNYGVLGEALLPGLQSLSDSWGSCRP